MARSKRLDVEPIGTCRNLQVVGPPKSPKPNGKTTAKMSKNEKKKKNITETHSLSSKHPPHLQCLALCPSNCLSEGLDPIKKCWMLLWHNLRAIPGSLHLISYFFKHDLTFVVPSPSRNRNIALTMGTTGKSLSESKWLKSSEVWEDKPQAVMRKNQKPWEVRHSIHKEYGGVPFSECTPYIRLHHKNTTFFLGTKKFPLWSSYV